MAGQINTLKARELFRQNNLERSFRAWKIETKEMSVYRRKKLNCFFTLRNKRMLRVFRSFCKAVKDFNSSSQKKFLARRKHKKTLMKKVFGRWNKYIERKERLFVKDKEAVRLRRLKSLEKAISGLKIYYQRNL